MGQIPDELKKMLPSTEGIGAKIPSGTFDGLGSVFKEMFHQMIEGIKKSFKFFGKIK